jgi:hypothetical protein
MQSGKSFHKYKESYRKHKKNQSHPGRVYTSVTSMLFEVDPNVFQTYEDKCIAKCHEWCAFYRANGRWPISREGTLGKTFHHYKQVMKGKGQGNAYDIVNDMLLSIDKHLLKRKPRPIVIRRRPLLRKGGVSLLKFIKMSKQRFGNRFSYAKTRIIHSKLKTTITCNIHDTDVHILPQTFA